jgi:hypothetical protein
MIVTKPPHGGTRLRGRDRLSKSFAPARLALLALFALAPFPRAASGGVNAGDSLQGTSSAAARRSAAQSIPFDKLDADSRAKVNSVLANASVFRRMPTRTVNCDPDLYLFLVRHPDVVVNVWELLGVAQLQLRQTDIDTFHVTEAEGTSASLELLYHSNDLQIACGKWTYTGSLLARRISGHFLVVLRTSYAKDAAGKYYVTARMDGFVSVESGAADLLARTLQPLMVKNVDANFIQTVAFLGSLSKTAEVNPQGMARLADRLSHVQPATRQQLGEVVNSVARRAANVAKANAQPDHVAGRVPSSSGRE